MSGTTALAMLAFTSASLFAAGGASPEISLQTPDGDVVISGVRFPEPPPVADLSWLPVISYRITNRTSRPIRSLGVVFEMSGFCLDKPTVWIIGTTADVGWDAAAAIWRNVSETVEPLRGRVTNCRATLISARLANDNDALPLASMKEAPPDVAASLQELLQKEQARYAKEAQEQRAAAIAKQQEADRIESERLAATARKMAAQAVKDRAAAAARATAIAKERADEEQRQKTQAEIRAAEQKFCTDLYRATANKRIVDLTVKEEQQVRACQAAGLYAQ